MIQVELSEAQAVILCAACQREDGLVFPVTPKLKGGPVGNICKSLLKRGLIEEVEATDLNTVWRHDEERGPITLRATPLAYAALGIGEDDQTSDDVVGDEPVPESTIGRLKGDKQAKMIEMLKASEGATIQQMTEAFGWQPHSVRGAIAGALKKKGFVITSEKIDGRGRVYHIAD